MRRIIISLALVLFIVSCRSNSQPSKEGKKEKEEKEEIVQKEKIPAAELNAYRATLTAFFDTMLLNRNFNGGILIAKGGNILYESYIGYSDLQKRTDTITPHTVFHLASTSKPFTGVAVMKLVEQGMIGLDDDIIKYFSGFPYSGVTVRHLLTHRSGMPNYLYFMDDKQKWNQSAMPSNKDVLDFLVRYQPAKTANPGMRFQYCNTNYVLLALIVEKVTGKSFPQYMKETIFEPLGMKNTFVYTPADSMHVPMSYKPSGALWANDKYENTYGDKNIYSTPRDLFKWDSALYREDFVSKVLLDSSFVPRSHEKPSIHNYGYGWRMLNLKNGKNVIYHFGKWHGFTPAFARLIDEKAVIIILGNRYSQSMYEAAKHSYDIFGPYMSSDSTVDQDDVQPTGPVNESQLKTKVEKKAVQQTKKVAETKKPATAKPVAKTTTKKTAASLTNSTTKNRKAAVATNTVKTQTKKTTTTAAKSTQQKSTVKPKATSTKPASKATTTKKKTTKK